MFQTTNQITIHEPKKFGRDDFPNPTPSEDMPAVAFLKVVSPVNG
jgi:hypothetical protein